MRTNRTFSRIVVAVLILSLVGLSSPVTVRAEESSFKDKIAQYGVTAAAFLGIGTAGLGALWAGAKLADFMKFKGILFRLADSPALPLLGGLIGTGAAMYGLAYYALGGSGTPAPAADQTVDFSRLENAR